MEKQVLFRDYQEQQAEDHNNLQAYASQSIDHIVHDGLTASRRYAGFNVSKSAQAEVTVAAGRFYDSDGAVYNRSTEVVQSMLAYLAAASKRIVVVSATGVENEVDVTERDYLVNVETGQTEPRAVAMTLSRDAILSFTAGAESVDPQAPPIPASHVAVAYVLLDTLQVVSVTMQSDNEVTRTEDLDQRADVLEAWKLKTDPKVSALSSDLAELSNRVGRMGSQVDLSEIKIDLARVKESLRYPTESVSYGADFFLYIDHSDVDNTALLGYDALIMEGCRFPDANANEFELSLFSPNDPNARYINGVLLPAFDHDLKISTGDYVSDLGIAQYGFQTFTMKTGYMSRMRVRYGGSLWQCSNGAHWGTPGQPSGAANLYDQESWGVVSSTVTNTDPEHYTTRTDTYWFDTWKEPFDYTVTTDNVITGAQIAQSFLVSNDIWATRVGFYVTVKAAAENIIFDLCEVTNGVPDRNKVVAHAIYPHASIVLGWNYLDITPSFLRKGKRYAFCVTADANHKFGMTSGQSYLDGTFFYSTDGDYYLGDLTKDMMMRVYGAKFAASQVTVEFAPINLDGGFRYVDILAHAWMPESTDLIYEVRPSGVGSWQPLTADNAGVLGSAPALAQFRARFVGTRDMHAGITLTGSRVHVSRPKTAFKHVSEQYDVDSTTDIVVRAMVEGFDDTPHDINCRLRIGGAYENSDSAVVKLLDLDRKRYEITYTFTPAATTAFRIVFDGTTNSPQSTFHIAERVFYTL